MGFGSWGVALAMQAYWVDISMAHPHSCVSHAAEDLLSLPHQNSDMALLCFSQDSKL